MKYINIKTFFVVFILIAVTWGSIVNYVAGEIGYPLEGGNTSNDWVIEYGDCVTRSDENITVNGSLIVEAGGSLDLSNVQLTMNCSTNNNSSIIVKPGGSLILYSTSIQSDDENYTYEFIVEGDLYMKNCTVNNLRGNPDEPESGIQLSSDAVIVDSTINSNSGTGIYINQSNPIISNNNIDSNYYGIYFYGPQPTLIVTPKKVCMITNRSIQFNVSGGNSTYTWESSNTTVGTINGTGVFTSNNTGGTIIKVTDQNNNIGKATVIVSSDPCTNPKISPTYIIMYVNTKLQFNATNATNCSNTFNWSVDNLTYGSIDQIGTFTANCEGICNIQVSGANNTTAYAVIEIDSAINPSDSCLICYNNFSNNQVGIALENASPELSNNTFYSNNISLQFSNSSSFLLYCSIENSSTYDLEIDSNSSPKLNYTTYNYTKISADDIDEDSMPDYFEAQYSLNQSSNDSASDPDSDSLSNFEEFRYCTDPQNPDTDFDENSDYYEIMIWNTNPISAIEYLVLEKDLIIDNGQTLKLSNSFVIMKSDDQNTYEIHVSSGGSLYLTSSEIGSNDPDYPFEFEVEGYLEMTDCSIDYIDGDSNDPGGIQLYANSKIIRSEITDCDGAGIYVYDCAPEISNNELFDCYYGIYIEGSTAVGSTISNNDISDCDYGLYLDSTSPDISENVFESNEISISFDNSNSYIDECIIRTSTTYDLEVDASSSPIIEFTGYDYTKVSAIDTDSDGIPDWYEDQYGLESSNPNDATSDPDSDGLTNLQEYQHGTDPFSDDTDSDGLTDSAEVNIWGTNPLNVDTDSDNLVDLSEVQNNIYWFEGEDNLHSTDGLGVNKIDDPTANDPDLTDPVAAKTNTGTGNGEIIDVSLQNLIPGKYFYYIKARLTSNEPTNLKIKYYDPQEHYVTKTIFDNNYRWYKYDSTIDLQQNNINLRAQDESQTGTIYVDKGVFLKVSDSMAWTVTTTDDPDDTITFPSGGGEITVNLNIPIEGEVTRYVTKANMNIRAVSTETGKGLGSDKKVAGGVNEWNNLPDIAVVKDDPYIRRHIVYQRRIDTWDEGLQTWSTTKGVEYQTSTDCDTWSSKTIDPGDIYYGTPTIDAFNENIHVVFANLEGDTQIFYRKSTDKGSTWIPTDKDDMVFSDGTDDCEPNIDVDGNNVHVVWYDNSNGDIYYSKSMTNGDSWGIVNEEITEDGMDPMQNPNIAVSSSNIHIIYDDLDVVKYTKLCNNGNTIIDHTTLPEEIISIDESPNAADIAVDGKNIHVVWVDYRDYPYDGEIYYKRSTDNGRTWDSDAKLSNSAAESIEPCVAVDGKHSLVYVFWSEYVDDNYEIHYIRSDDDGASWGSISQFTSDDDIDSRRPKAAAYENGEFHVVYYDDFDGPELGPPPAQVHDCVYYNYIQNDIPTIPDLDVGNDDSIDYEPGSYETMYPIYDFSKEINKYIKDNEGQISGGYINVPLTFISDEEGTFELLDIDVQLGPDISDVHDPDTDTDNTLDGDEFNNGQGLFHPEYSFEHFASSPAIVQYVESSVTETKVVVGGDGLFCYDENGDYEWQYWPTEEPHIAGSPAVADYDADGDLEIIFGSVEGIVYCLGVDKTLEWSYDTNKPDSTTKSTYPNFKASPIYSSPAIADIETNNGKSEIIFVNQNGYVIRFDNSPGTVNWITDLTEHLHKIAEWEEKTPEIIPTPPPTLSARKDHAIASQSLCSLLFGGYDSSGYKGDTWAYVYDDDLWVNMNPQGSTPTARSNHAMATVHGTNLHVLFGGEFQGGSGPTLDGQTWVYDLDQNSWMQMNPQWMPDPMKQLTARKEHAMATIGDTEHVLLFGGEKPGASGPTLDGETWRYNFNCDGWFEDTSMLTTSPTARKCHAMASVWGTDQVVMFGGRTGSGATALSQETWIYDYNDGSPTWTDKTPSSPSLTDYPSKRENHAMATIWGTKKVILFGGHDGSTELDDTWIYDLSDFSWTKMDYWNKDPPTARQNHALGTIYSTNNVVLFGGYDGSLNDGTYICELNYDKLANTYSSPVIGDIDNDNVLEIIICDNNGKIYCLNHLNPTTSNNLEWIYIIDSPIKSTPAIGDIDNNNKQEIVVGADNGEIYCLNHDGTPHWTSPFKSYLPVRSSPAIANVDVSTEELEIVIGSDNGVVYCLKNSGELDWQFPDVGEVAKGAFRATPVSVDLNTFPDGGYETIAISENGYIYSIDTVGAVDNDYSYYSYRAHSSIGDYSFISSPAVADIDDDKILEIVLGPKSYDTTDTIYKKDTTYGCYPQAIKWGMLGAGTKHNGNGDNRFAIIIQGSDGDNSFEEDQFRANVQEMARILTEHPRNIKPGPGYTGYYLQNHIAYAGTENDIPEVDRDYKIERNSRTTNYKPKIEKYIFNKIAVLTDSYDNVILFYTSHGGYYKERYKEYDGFEWEWKYRFTFLFDANDHHGQGYTSPTMDDKYSTDGDYSTDDIDKLLKKIKCYKLFIILQPCYSGNWINTLNKDKNEQNRVIITSVSKASTDTDTGAVSNKVSIFDKCNDDIDDLNKRWVIESTTEEDGEDFKNTKPSSYKYVATDNLNSERDNIYEIDNDADDNIIDFYENPNDVGAEIVSGLIEAFYIDRDYYYYDSGLLHHQPNDYLDADDDASNNDPEITQGDQNNYITCKEIYYFMLNWHLGYKLGNGKIGGPSPGSTNKWYDNPQIRYTQLEISNNYLF